MNTEAEELKPLSEISQVAQFQWTLGELSRLFKLTKKQLRAVVKIIEASQSKAKVFKKGKEVEKIFVHGFNNFMIRGKKNREIFEPHPELQWIFIAVKNWLEEHSAHEKAFGFVRERNCKKAGESLIVEQLPLFRNRHFISLDISKAFPSVTDKMVKDMFLGLGVNELVAEALAWLVTCQDKNGQRCLPQGSSCSPIILNLVFKPMCEEFDRVCRTQGIIDWAVYVDDFTFAAPGISEKTKKELLVIPEKFGFKVKDGEIKDNRGKTIPHMLGLTIVDDKIHIRRGRKKEYRRIFHEALKGLHSPQKVRGIANSITCIYGKNWPGWLRKPYTQYLNQRAKEVRASGGHIEFRENSAAKS